MRLRIVLDTYMPAAPFTDWLPVRAEATIIIALPRRDGGMLNCRSTFSFSYPAVVFP